LKGVVGASHVPAIEMTGQAQDRVVAAFRRFDLNGDGYISLGELKCVLRTLNASHWDDRRLSRVLNKLDQNRDGRVQYTEFVRWACGKDDNAILSDFRNVVKITCEDGKNAPPALPRRPRSSSIRRPRCTTVSAGVRSRAVSASRLAQTPKAMDAEVASEAAVVSSDVSREEGCSTASLQRLLVFDFDATITVDKDCQKGLHGKRLQRLLEMMRCIRDAGARCVLVTAQFPSTTRDITIPMLTQTGLSGLFVHNLPLTLYREDKDHGTIYNGAEAMMGKIALVKKIISGDNCWSLAFEPHNVLFIDDSAANFKGSETTRINLRHVQQDGMEEDDIAVVEAFA